MVQIRRAFSPDLGRVGRYDALYGQYRALYVALRPVFAELAQFEA